MNAKLTLRLDEDVIRRAKDYSRAVGRPVSHLVEDYFTALTAPRHDEPDLPPITRSLKGALAGTRVDEEDYWRHLESKHR